MLVLLALVGCWLGRVLGPRLKTCPYRLSAQLAAALPILASLASRSSLFGLKGVLVGLGALLGVFLSGHGNRWRALGFCTLGSALGGLTGGQLG
ncbi:MAG: hypothetical protein KIS61_12320 [Candidatus Eremiobacteraeota bacterium]|nr:hypothetical protein [Candidatus Eremiobacteraeota bacterium]